MKNKQSETPFSFSFYTAVVVIGLTCVASCKKDDQSPVPAIISIHPVQGEIGVEVTIAGVNFSDQVSRNAVTFSGVSAEVKRASATQIVAVVPVTAVTGPVMVMVNGQAATGPDFTVITPVSLTISALTPSSGPKGTAVTITGTGFSVTPSDNKVKFNGKHAVVKSATETALVVEVPLLAGTGKVSVVSGNQHIDGPDFQYAYTYTVKTIAGGTTGSADGTGAAAQFNGVFDLVIAKDGNIYVVDFGNSKVREITPGGVVTTFAGTTVGYRDDDDPLKAEFAYVNGITQDDGGNFYISEGPLIRKIDVNCKVTTLAGSPTTVETIDGTGTAAAFRIALFVRISDDGDLYVADPADNVIRKVTLLGVVTTIAGAPGFGNEKYQDGPVATARFATPDAAIVDAQGDVYIAEQKSTKIRKLSHGFVTTLAGGGPGAKDGPPDVAQFAGQFGGMAIDQAGNIYVGDYSNHSIRMITPSGYVTTIAGSLGVSGFQDGSGNGALFNNPRGVDFDAEGNLYVADFGNNAIRKIIIE